MDARLIQRKLTLGNRVSLLLKTNHQITGVLQSIGTEYVEVKSDNGGITTVMIDMIGMFTDLTASNQVAATVPPKLAGTSQAPVVDPSVMRIEADEPSAEPTPPRNAALSNPVSAHSEDAEEKSLSNSPTEFDQWLADVTTRVKDKVETATVDVRPPSFDIADFPWLTRDRQQFASAWRRIRDKYVGSIKSGELSPRSSKAQELVEETQALIKQYPEAHLLQAYLSYFLYLSGEFEKAYDHYRALAYSSSSASDWINYSINAMRAKRPIDACVGFVTAFRQASITGYLSEWHVFIRLVQQTRSWWAIHRLASEEGRPFSEAERKVLFNSLIYLASISGNNGRLANLVSADRSHASSPTLIQRIAELLSEKDSGNGEPREQNQVKSTTVTELHRVAASAAVASVSNTKTQGRANANVGSGQQRPQLPPSATTMVGNARSTAANRYSIGDVEQLIKEARRARDSPEASQILHAIIAIRSHTLPKAMVYRESSLRDALIQEITDLVTLAVEGRGLSNTEKAQACKFAGDVLRALLAHSAAGDVYYSLSSVASGVRERANALGVGGECYLAADQPARALELLLRAVPAAPDNPNFQAAFVRAVGKLLADESATDLLNEAESAYPELFAQSNGDLEAQEEEGSLFFSLDDIGGTPFVAFIIRNAQWPVRILENASQENLDEAISCWSQAEALRAEIDKKRQRDEVVDPQEYQNSAFWYGAAARIYQTVYQKQASSLDRNIDFQFQPSNHEKHYANALSSYLGMLGPYHLSRAFGALKSPSVNSFTAQEAADVAADMFVEALLLRFVSENISGSKQPALRSFLQSAAIKANVLAALGEELSPIFPFSLADRWDFRVLRDKYERLFSHWRQDPGSASPLLAHLGFRCGQPYLRFVSKKYFGCSPDTVLGISYAKLESHHEDFVGACASILEVLREFDDIFRLGDQVAILQRTRYLLRRTDMQRVDKLINAIDDARAARGLRTRTMVLQLDEVEKQLAILQDSFEAVPTFDGIAQLLPLCDRLRRVIQSHRDQIRRAQQVDLKIATTGVDYSSNDGITFQLRVSNQGSAVAKAAYVKWEKQALQKIREWVADDGASITPSSHGPWVLDEAGDRDLEFKIVSSNAPNSRGVSVPCTVIFRDDNDEDRQPRSLSKWVELSLSSPAPAGPQRGIPPYDPKSHEGAPPQLVRGRQTVVKELIDWTTEPERYSSQKSIYGLARSGKTSVLRLWAHSMLEGEYVVNGKLVLPIRINVDISADYPFDMIAYRTMRYLRGQPDWPTEIGTPLPTVAREAQDLANHFLSGVPDHDGRFDGASGPTRHAWGEMLREIEKLGVWPVLMLDEFDEFWKQNRERVGDGFFNEMRGLSANWGNFAYCGLWRLYDIFFDPEDALYTPSRSLTTQKQFPIGPLRRSGFEEMVREYGCTWWEFEDSAIERLWELSGGEPIFVSLLCNRLWMEAEQCLITRIAVDRILDSTLKEYRELIHTVVSERQEFSVLQVEQDLAAVLYNAIAQEQSAQGAEFVGLTSGELYDRVRSSTYRLASVRAITEAATDRVLRKAVERGWLTVSLPLDQYRLRADLIVAYLTQHPEGRQAWRAPAERLRTAA